MKGHEPKLPRHSPQAYSGASPPPCSATTSGRRSVAPSGGENSATRTPSGSTSGWSHSPVVGGSGADSAVARPAAAGSAFARPAAAGSAFAPPASGSPRAAAGSAVARLAAASASAARAAGEGGDEASGGG